MNVGDKVKIKSIAELVQSGKSPKDILMNFAGMEAEITDSCTETLVLDLGKSIVKRNKYKLVLVGDTLPFEFNLTDEELNKIEED